MENFAATSAFSAVAADLTSARNQHEDRLRGLRADIVSLRQTIRQQGETICSQGQMISVLREELAAAQEAILEQSGLLGAVRSELATARALRRDRSADDTHVARLAVVEERLAHLKEGYPRDITPLVDEELPGGASFGPPESGSTTEAGADTSLQPDSAEAGHQSMCNGAQHEQTLAKGTVDGTASLIEPRLVTVVSTSSQWPGYDKENLLQASGSWVSGADERVSEVIFDLGQPSQVNGIQLSTEGSTAGPARWPQEVRLATRHAAEGPWLPAGTHALDEPSSREAHRTEVPIKPNPVMALQVKIEFCNEEALYFPPDGLAARGERAGAIAVGRVQFY
mmetsp:Transcript_123938/g.246743  ORF Transcript_123938/g.246743 Transcript_123938/m.246743 type:complete len:339 (+) Transcript_123938:56-1072(+)